MSVNNFLLPGWTFSVSAQILRQKVAFWRVFSTEASDELNVDLQVRLTS
jgi:hypothetical protein